MKEIKSEELKFLQKQILKDIHKFCSQNSIRYSLALGTLLGAVRHGGFIPWDDDIDVMMPREDYERFISTYQHPIYVVADLSTDKKYHLPFAKVSDSRTILIEEADVEPSFGVNVDIFPIDNVPDDESEYNHFFRYKWFWNYIQWAKILKTNKKRGVLKNVLLIMAKAVLFLIPRSSVVKKIKTIATKYRYSDTNRMGLIVPDDNKYKWVMDKHVFDEYIEIKFEDMFVYSVKDYDTYLRAMYDDYMKLPPVEQRVTHHGFRVWWKE